MAETLIKENKKRNYIYGITPEVRKEAQERVEKMIQAQGLKRFTEKDFQRNFESEQTQKEIQVEVDEFLQMCEEWREENRKMRKERQ